MVFIKLTCKTPKKNVLTCVMNIYPGTNHRDTVQIILLNSHRDHPPHFTPGHVHPVPVGLAEKLLHTLRLPS